MEQLTEEVQGCSNAKPKLEGARYESYDDNDDVENSTEADIAEKNCIY
jgi:hypothetical protein